jgi:integrase
MVKQRDQHRPTVEQEEVEALLSKVKRPVYAMVAALLCGTGIRISELLALEIGKHISADCKVITIGQQRGEKATLEPPKTENGYRDIDLCEPLANALKNFIGKRKGGFLLQTDNGKMLSRQNLWRDDFATIARDMGLDIGFHAFRRFRESILQASECRDLLINFSMGHGDAEMSSRYAKQLVQNRKFRQEWSAKVGLGFEIPKSELTAIRAIRNPESTVAA